MRRFLLASICCAAMMGIAHADEVNAEEPTPAANLQLTYTGEIWNVASGGIERDLVYLDSLDVQFSFDLERLTGWKGAQAFLYAVYTNDNSLGELTADHNGVSNLESGVEGLRIYEAWIDQAFADGKGSVRVGLYDLNSEFDAGEVRALFMNAGHGIGTDYAQSGQNGPSIWPVTSLAVRVNYNFEDNVYLMGAIADGVPGSPGHPERASIDFQEGDGLLLAAETGISTEGRIWSLGVWGYSEEFPDLVTADEHFNAGAYIALEERLMSKDAGDAMNLSGSFRVGIANDDINPISSFISATLVATGLVAAWPEDQIGLGFMIANAGDKFLDSSGLSEDNEINIELTYFANLSENVTIQPDIQWVVNPGMDGTVDDVWVFGLRLSVNKNWSLD